jgi:hypothetical protein
VLSRPEHLWTGKCLKTQSFFLQFFSTKKFFLFYATHRHCSRSAVRRQTKTKLAPNLNHSDDEKTFCFAFPFPILESLRNSFSFRGQRPVFNNMVCPQVWSLSLGVKFAPRGELGPQGWTLFPRGSVHPYDHPRGDHSLLFRRMEGRTDNFTPRG